MRQFVKLGQVLIKVSLEALTVGHAGMASAKVLLNDTCTTALLFVTLQLLFLSLHLLQVFFLILLGLPLKV